VNKLVVGIFVVAAIVVSVLVYSFSGTLSLSLGDGLESYEGKLVYGNSVFTPEGKAVVELVFEDGRSFVGSEDMAREVGMVVGKSYLIKYNVTDPSFALSIKEIS